MVSACRFVLLPWGPVYYRALLVLRDHLYASCTLILKKGERERERKGSGPGEGVPSGIAW